MVFDVESIGLHGEGFAVGYVLCYAFDKFMAESDSGPSVNMFSSSIPNTRKTIKNLPRRR